VKTIFFSIFIYSLLSQSALAKNLHLIDSKPNGFAIYRSGEPSKKDMKEFCKLGIQEIAVLSGSAEKNEWKYQAACPTLKVIYNEEQRVQIPLTDSFLKEFDQWVEEAQNTGKVIAFRCSCGCHRTGRLAAYYQMKYQGLSRPEAITIMNKLGKHMSMYPQLLPQVQALEDYIQGRPCSVKQEFCVQPN
jgi:hypothetical protein